MCVCVTVIVSVSVRVCVCVCACETCWLRTKIQRIGIGSTGGGIDCTGGGLGDGSLGRGSGDSGGRFGLRSSEATGNHCKDLLTGKVVDDDEISGGGELIGAQRRSVAVASS